MIREVPVNLSARSRVSHYWLVKAAVATALTAAVLPAAHAADGADAEAGLSEIVVTGSRITRRDYSSDSPIVTVTSDALQNTSEVGVETVLNNMPQFVPGQNQFGGAVGITVTPTQAVGASTANLRGLGDNRTLVLLDGRRTQPVNASLTVDLNTIPSAAVESVEVITGGAGATYGADAVAGVVNFKLKRNYQGVTLDAQAGTTFEGDGAQRTVTALMGSNFAEGRGNAMIGMTFSRRDVIYRNDRDFFAESLTDPWSAASQFPVFSGFVAGAPGNITNSPAGGAPSATVANQVFMDKNIGLVNNEILTPSATAPGGFNAPTAYYFNKAATTDQATIFLLSQGRTTGTLSPGYQGGLYPDAKYVIGNVNTGARTLTTNNTAANKGGYLQVPLTRYSLFTNGYYELSPRAEVYMQARFDENTTKTSPGDYAPAGNQWGATVPYGNGIYAPSVDSSGNTLADYQAGGKYGLNCDPTGGCTNSQAFPVAPELATLLDSRANPDLPWTLNQNTTFMPVRSLTTQSRTYEILAGVRGEMGFRDWTYDVFASRGNASQNTDYNGFINALAYQTLLHLPNYGRAATYNNGRLGVLADCTTGINPFVNTPVSQDCIDILDSNAKLTQSLEQVQSELNIQGSLAEVPAGDLRFAAGLSYRKNTYEYLPDNGMATTNINSVVLGQFDTTETRGEVAVKEIYGEILAPIVSDLPFMQKLELNAGYRYSDYNTATGGVSTWKLTANWDVNDLVKIRGGHQVANRAPNIAELFSPPVFTIVNWTDHDPCSNLTRASWGNSPENTTSRGQVQALCNAVIRLQGPSNINVDNAYAGQNAVYFPLGRDLVEGNPDIKSEEAKTWTAGVVLRSPFESDLLNRATLSVDWYSIKIDGALASASTPYVYQECFNAFGTNPTYDVNNDFCQRIIRDPATGNWTATRAQYMNLSTIKTSGIDATFDYRVDTPFFGGRSGTMSLSVNANWLFNYDVQVAPTLDAFDYADSIGSIYGGQYKWKLQTLLGYSVGPLSMNFGWRHLPTIRHFAKVTDPNNTNEPMSAYHLFNLNGRWAVNDSVAVRVGIDNLFDRQPPRYGANYVPTASGSGYSEGIGATQVSYYDVAGRRFFVGVNIQF